MNSLRWISLAVGIAIASGFPCGTDRPPQRHVEDSAMSLEITRPAFQEGGEVPPRHTADGPDVSPEISWGSAPEGTKSFAIICDDPDAPAGTWVHWVIWGIPAGESGLKEGVPKDETLASGARQGKNDFGRTGYGGPAPPPGSAHRYFFKVYAIDRDLLLQPGATKADLEKAMEGHILGSGQLVGKYQRG